jgi:regulator of nucleoside diphosphate kinase
MITQNVLSRTDIIITEKDFDRLQGVVDSPRYRATHAALLMALKNELERGKVVAADEVPTRVVTMHSQVRIRDLRTDDSETYTLVYPEEADINDGKLSVLAPLGTALLGTRAGQVVKFDVPAGQRRLKVEKIIYQPEAAGDFHL